MFVKKVSLIKLKMSEFVVLIARSMKFVGLELVKCEKKTHKMLKSAKTLCVYIRSLKSGTEVSVLNFE
ncbi:hypothetical protein HpBhutan227_07930 [Helicobacter pylori]